MDRRTTVRVLRFLVGALFAGLVSFALVVVLVLGPFAGEDPAAGALLAALAGLAVVLLAAYPVVRQVLLRQLARRHGGEPPEDNEPALLEGYKLVTLIGAAMTEAVGLFATVVYLVTGVAPVLIAAGAAAALLLLQLPSEERYRGFAEQVTGRRPA